MKNHWNAVNPFLKIHLNDIKKQIKALNTAFNQFNIFQFSNWIDKGNKNHMNPAYGNQHLRKLCNNLLLNLNRVSKQEKCRSISKVTFIRHRHTYISQLYSNLES